MKSNTTTTTTTSKRKSAKNNVFGILTLLVCSKNKQLRDAISAQLQEWLNGEYKKLGASLYSDSEFCSKLPYWEQYLNQFLPLLGSSKDGMVSVVSTSIFSELSGSDSSSVAKKAYNELLLNSLNTIIVAVSNEDEDTSEDYPENTVYFNTYKQSWLDLITTIKAKLDEVSKHKDFFNLIAKMARNEAGLVLGNITGEKHIKAVVKSSLNAINYPIDFREWCEIMRVEKELADYDYDEILLIRSENPVGEYAVAYSSVLGNIDPDSCKVLTV